MNQPRTTDLTIPGLIHDLNNVFQTLVDTADLLGEDARWGHVSAAILRSVERGKAIASSLHANQGPGGPFETIVANEISFVEDWRGGRGASIRFQCGLEPGIILRHPWAWERVLINLFLNSIRAMPSGGSISVTAGREGDNVRIVVSDDGSGIPPEILKDVFQPGFSASASSGLGLHIVEEIVRQDGGQVHASNRIPEGGAQFTILLPAAAAVQTSSGAA